MGSIKAVALLSGGLDSTLAMKIIKDQGVEVEALNFKTGLGLTDHRMTLKGKKNYQNAALRAGAQLGIKVRIIDISDEYMEVVINPKHGYGSAINPCIDCRILMLKKAKEYMEKTGGHFVITGEVLRQRPMTQHLGTLRLIEKESGLDRLIVRPLSAKLLPPSIPEEKGWINRDKLYAISGRSRKEQMRLAQMFGITHYPQPAGGGCFLTDENYARKLKDLFVHRDRETLSQEDLDLLKVGRHFRLSDGLKVIVGRDEKENRFLERYRKGKWAFQVIGFEGPLTLAEGEPTPEEITAIARITARYSDGKNEPSVKVRYERDEIKGEVIVSPMDQQTLEGWRI